MPLSTKVLRSRLGNFGSIHSLLRCRNHIACPTPRTSSARAVKRCRVYHWQCTSPRCCGKRWDWKGHGVYHYEHHLRHPLGPGGRGFIYDYAGYFAVFLPAFALIGLDIILRFMMIVEKRIPFDSSPVESPKLTSASVGATDNTYGTNHKSMAKADQSISKGGEFLGANFHEPQQDTEEEPLLPKPRPRSVGSSIPVLLSSPRFSVAVISLFFVNSFTTGFDGVLAVYVHDAFRFSATNSACLFLILALPTLLSPISGALTDRTGTKLPAAGGLLLLTPTLILLRLIYHGVTLPFVKLGLAMFSVGVSVTLLNPAFIKETSSAVKAIEQGRPGIFGPFGANAQAYGLLSCAFAGGSMVGPLYAGFIRRRFGWSVIVLCYFR